MIPDPNLFSEQINIKPLSVHIGAEIDGIDLTKSLSSLEVTTIRQALLRWRVIFFRKQHLTHSQHINSILCLIDQRFSANHVCLDDEYLQVERLVQLL